jgi:hypothetical protein
MFYMITRNDGGIIDEDNDAPYLIVNDVAAAEKLLNELPNVVHGYHVQSAEVESDHCILETYCTTS